MKIPVYTCLLILLMAFGGRSFASDGGEPEYPAFVPPASPLQTYYEALAALEQKVDDYFHAALRQRIAVSDARLRALDDALGEEARLSRESNLPTMLTEREMVVRAKLTVLRELDDRFVDGALPADLELTFSGFFQKRKTAIGLLVEGGAL